MTRTEITRVLRESGYTMPQLDAQARAQAFTDERARETWERVTMLRRELGENFIAHWFTLTHATKEESARLFGVTPHEVQRWAEGASMSAQHTERLARAIDAVSTLGTSPEERQRRLKGTSFIHDVLR